METKKKIVKDLLDGKLSESELISAVESRKSYIVWDGYFEDVYGVKHKDVGQKEHKGHTLIRFGDNSIMEGEDNE